MGPHTIHIGGGRPASWGGAEWIEQARRAGVQKQLTPAQLQTALGRQAQPTEMRAGHVPFLGAGAAGLDTAPLDRAPSQRVDVNGTGKLSVDVKAPEGTKVAAEGAGLFKDTEVKRQTQMAPAGDEE
jgi:hypothetical protein